MKKITQTAVIIALLLASLPGNTQNLFSEFSHLFTPARNYVVYRTTDAVNIDGEANEKSWKKAEWSEHFRDIEGDKCPEPLHPTKMKMMWDDENLYIYAELEEPHIWAYYDKMDMIVFHENDFEVFIDPDRNAHDYYEFEVNARNTLFDLFLNRPYRKGGTAHIKWNAKGFKSAVKVIGTLNDPTDEDKKWTVEMAIPFASLTTTGDYLQPTDGSLWKINFSRVNWQTDLVDGKYTRKINKDTGKRIPEYNWVWSPQGVINMHYPERWGFALFSENKVGKNKVKFQLPQEEELARYLWLTFYKQRKYSSKNKSYAQTLNQLQIPATGKISGVPFKMEMEGNKKEFTVTITTKTNSLTINQLGKIEGIK